MGELRYLPGFGPGERGAAPADPDPEPEWAVPGLTGPAERASVQPHSSGDPQSVHPESVGPELVGLVPVGPDARAERVSLAALTRHDVSEAEMAERLRTHGLEPAEVADEIERLKRLGLVDDALLAEREIERLRRRGGLGDRAIRARLQARSLDRDVVERALDAAADDDAALERLHEAARRRAGQLHGLAPEVAERRLTAFLARRGYSGGQVREAVRAALAAAD